MKKKFTEKQLIYIREVYKNPDDHEFACRKAGYKNPKVAAVSNMENQDLQDEIRRRIGGRPIKLTPEIEKKICDAIRLGMTYMDAALLAGISEKTFVSWRKKAKEGDPNYITLLQSLKKAESEGIAVNLKNLHTSANGENKGSWQASAWILERRHPEIYGKNIEVKVKKEKEDSGVDLSKLPDEDLAVIEEILKRHKKTIEQD